MAHNLFYFWFSRFVFFSRTFFENENVFFMFECKFHVNTLSSLISPENLLQLNTFMS